MEEWFATWAQLPFAKLHLNTIYPFAVCKNVTSLKIYSTSFLASNVFQLAASSPKLVKLTLQTYTPAVVTAAMLRQATQWLTSSSVQTFRFTNWAFEDAIDEATRDAFYTALFKQPSLKTLSLSNCNLTGLSVVELPASMRYFCITNCSLSPQSLVSLASAIGESNVLETLDLNMDMFPAVHHPVDGYLHVFEQILEGVSLSNLDCLALNYCGLWWQTLGPLLQRTSVKKLSLIGRAIQGNGNIQKVDLSRNNMTKEWMLALLKLAQGTQLKRIHMGEYDLEEHSTVLRTIASQQGVELEFYGD
ncbi:Aste57867_24154 [Aphanomyces stellatus]|uniref:Aste57867_22735 protein n=1 Tax=Aphanomyces stellatus TaxID=120398 RepID=A0A485LLL8_9STRA|nr:hypothetical protein As57867_024080 [Aphanomyces stellatus]KAF0685353.1 hypothetical protein As57867_022665 [Aphanomyces stellatus]VFT99388.1 Aste57867_22735 [Aphanomyces stellatus]VFU00796.1 Aste57867_24154 [Aphanomyces stellatus]